MHKNCENVGVNLAETAIKVQLQTAIIEPGMQFSPFFSYSTQ